MKWCGRRSSEITKSNILFSSPASTLASCKLSDLTNTSGVSKFFPSCKLSNSFANTSILIYLGRTAHDQIQRAAYDLIPAPRRESFHLLIGSRLFMQTLPTEMEHMLFFIVDNMNRGSKLIDDPDLKWEVAQLNLEAGEKALKESAFQSAAKYLLAGVSFLGPDSWGAKYNLSLNLYDAGTSF